MSMMTQKWQNKATATNILKKVQRKKNPVSSYTQLARELGAPIYPNYSGKGGIATSSTFRAHVKSTVGTKLFA